MGNYAEPQIPLKSLVLYHLSYGLCLPPVAVLPVSLSSHQEGELWLLRPLPARGGAFCIDLGGLSRAYAARPGRPSATPPPGASGSRTGAGWRLGAGRDRRWRTLSLVGRQQDRELRRLQDNLVSNRQHLHEQGRKAPAGGRLRCLQIADLDGAQALLLDQIDDCAFVDPACQDLVQDEKRVERRTACRRANT